MAYRDFFNINDMQLIIDICLNQIQREKKEDTRVSILKAIDTIMDHRMFKQYPYNLDSIQETVNELILYEDESKPYSDKERECLSKLNMKFQLNKLEK